MLIHLGVGGWVAGKLSSESWGSERDHCQSRHWDQPGFCPLHSSFWGLNSGEGLERAGAFLIPSAWRRLPSVLMGSFV